MFFVVFFLSFLDIAYDIIIDIQYTYNFFKDDDKIQGANTDGKNITHYFIADNRH